jgi:hypothetical protein
MENHPLPPNFKAWQLVLGSSNTNVIYALTKSGVIEQLRDSPKSLQHLSENCKLNPDVLYRTLRFAIAIDVIVLNNNEYSLTDTGKFLLEDVPGSLYGGLMLIGNEPWQRSWNNLLHSLTTGEGAFDSAMGDSFFGYLEKHPEYGEPYNNWMTTISKMGSKAISEAYDFTPFKTICDIGGGQGIMLECILSAAPHIKGILFDQESVLKTHLLSNMASRVEIKTGNFFESVPSADILIMKTVLHDWDDNKSLLILNSCKKVMTQDTKLLIVEMVIGNNSEIIGLFYDLHMQVMLAGRERTEDEFRTLLQRAGLKLNRIIPTKSPLKIIEASL